MVLGASFKTEEEKNKVKCKQNKKYEKVNFY